MHNGLCIDQEVMWPYGFWAIRTPMQTLQYHREEKYFKIFIPRFLVSILSPTITMTRQPGTTDYRISCIQWWWGWNSVEHMAGAMRSHLGQPAQATHPNNYTDAYTENSSVGTCIHYSYMHSYTCFLSSYIGCMQEWTINTDKVYIPINFWIDLIESRSKNYSDTYILNQRCTIKLLSRKANVGM